MACVLCFAATVTGLSSSDTGSRDLGPDADTCIAGTVSQHLLTNRINLQSKQRGQSDEKQ